MKKIAVFASGTGSNLASIIQYFKGHPHIAVSLVVSNKADSGAIQKANDNHIATLVLNAQQVADGAYIVQVLQNHHIDFIVLAGYLKMIPAALTENYDGRMLNVHPALLPKYGGKGMYGRHVHQAVALNSETETGITIHFVNAHYDEGEIVLQQKVAIAPGDDAEAIENKVRRLELEWFPKTIESVILQKKRDEF